MGQFLDGFCGQPAMPAFTGPVSASDLFQRGWRFGEVSGYDGKDFGPFQVLVRVADPEQQSAVLTLVSHTGQRVVKAAAEASVLRYGVRGSGFTPIGIDPIGIFAAGATQAINDSQAGWDAEVTLVGGGLWALYLTRVPPEADVPRARARLSGAS